MEQTVKFKVWLVIEEMYLDDAGVEQHRDVPEEETKYGEYATLEEARKVVDAMECGGGILPNPPMALDSFIESVDLPQD